MTEDAGGVNLFLRVFAPIRLFLSPRDEFLKLFPIRHGEVLQDDGDHGNLEGGMDQRMGNRSRTRQHLGEKLKF